MARLRLFSAFPRFIPPLSLVFGPNGDHERSLRRVSVPFVLPAVFAPFLPLLERCGRVLPEPSDPDHASLPAFPRHASPCEVRHARNDGAAAIGDRRFAVPSRIPPYDAVVRGDASSVLRSANTGSPITMSSGTGISGTSPTDTDSNGFGSADTDSDSA